MVRVNTDVLGISELKWMGTGEFNSDDHYIYYCGQESLRRSGVDFTVNNRVQNAVRGCNLKNVRMICLFSRQTIQHHSNPSLCPNPLMPKKLKLTGAMKTLESPLDYKEIQPANSKGNQPCKYIGRTDAEAETPILWPPDAKS